MYQIIKNFKDGTIACDGFTDEEIQYAYDSYDSVLDFIEFQIIETGHTNVLSIYLIESESTGWMRIRKSRIFL